MTIPEALAAAVDRAKAKGHTHAEFMVKLGISNGQFYDAMDGKLGVETVRKLDAAGIIGARDIVRWVRG